MLHIPTLLLALLLGFLLLTLELGVSQRGLQARPEIRRWTMGSWALLGGFAALAARALVPVELSILLGNALICLGLAVYVQAIHQLLLSAPAPRWLMQCQPLLWLALALMLDWPLHRRTALLSLVYVVLLAPSVWVILRHGWHAERSLRTVALTMAMAIVALLVRALHAWLTPGDYVDLMQASLGQGLTFLFAFMCLLGAGFGFVLAVFERVARQMEEVATHDGLTGCWNRSTTDALLEHELQRSRRSGAPVAFVLLDLDHFKQVNDLHGHRAGDAVLKAFADTVRARLRASDVFGRTGGEEFGLVLPGTDLAGARWLVETVRREVETLALTDADSRPMAVTVSAGIAMADGGTPLSGDRLYGQADQALYEAKRSGRNRVEAFGAGNGASAALPLA
ncbi:MAG: GGDEF domain-containing protein [Burkholderiaceae bacterium]|nr:GGDEF domain-containing protein [Burkholderiaceae bacterium]